jgi:hypothetical protein
MATVTQNYGTYTALTVTNLHSLAGDTSDPYGGWQSAKVDNQSSVKAIDYEIMVEIAAVNTAPGGNKAVYVYVAPCITTDGGTTWKYSDNGAAGDLLDGTEGTTSISEPNSMYQLMVIPYTTQNMVLNRSALLSTVFGNSMPDGFQIVIRHDMFGGTTGLASSGNIVAYRAIKQDIA